MIRELRLFGCPFWLVNFSDAIVIVLWLTAWIFFLTVKDLLFNEDFLKVCQSKCQANDKFVEFFEFGSLFASWPEDHAFSEFLEILDEIFVKILIYEFFIAKWDKKVLKVEENDE